MMQEVRVKRRRRFNGAVLFMAMLGVVFLLVFNYIPMAGVLIAFKDMDRVLNIAKALMEKPLIGFANFAAFLKDRAFIDIMVNTVGMNLMSLIIGFPAPIILALLLNEVRHARLKKTVQTVTYFPYFISWVVFGGVVISMLSPDNGVVNALLQGLGIIKKPISFLSDAGNFWGIVIVTGILKGIGWGTVIYLAAISGIDVTQYEAATIDGANRFQRMWHITLPGIIGTIIVFLLLNISNLLNSSFDQIFILQNPLNLSRSEVIDTFVYKMGIPQMRYSFTTAVGIFKSAIAFVLLTGSHLFSKRFLGRGIY